MSFHVVSASAGAGKTYKLTLEVLSSVLSPEDQRPLRRILAVTFTNKAANEMKIRLLEMLKMVARGESEDLMDELSEKLGLSTGQLQKIAARRIDEILFNFDDLSYSTIDSFTFRLIRHFARELGLTPGVNVEINEEEAVDLIVEHYLRNLSQEDKSLPELKFLSSRKIEDDKNWDVFEDLAGLKRYILPDKYIEQIQTIKKFDTQEINEQKHRIFVRIRSLENEIKKNASKLLEILSGEEIKTKISNFNHINGLLNYLKENYVPLKENKTFPKWFNNEQIDDNLLKKNQFWTQEERTLISAYLRPLYRDVGLLKKLYTFRQAITPLSLIHVIVEAIENYKNENDQIFISDFNKIIHRVLKDNPVPFIYYRTGEKYFHYFIDEFQDTSVLQWKNILPLIDEALSKEYQNNRSGNAYVFGDAKQAIYRFRGSEPEQFIKLSSPKISSKDYHPFPSARKHIIRLDANWRSAKDIVKFNNVFFEEITRHFGVNSELYNFVYQKENVHQKMKKHFPGYVEMKLNKINDDEEYLNQIVDTVRRVRNLNYDSGDIAILYNRNEEGAKIAKILIENGFHIISDNSLQLKNSRKLNLLINFYRYFDTENPEDLLYALLDLQAVKGTAFETGFYDKLKERPFHEVIKILSGKTELPSWDHLGAYEFFSSLIFALDLNDENEAAYVKTFLTKLNRFENNRLTPSDFFEYWDKVLSSIPVENESHQGAIRLMTVHKAKGLEFPVVIYAYANQKTEPRYDSLIWLPTGDSIEIPFLPVRYTDLEHIFLLSSEYAEELFAFREAHLFDLINKIYVAFTRPVEKLYILANNKTGQTHHIFRNIAGSLTARLLEADFNETQGILKFGEEKPALMTGKKSEKQYVSSGFYAKPPSFESPVIKINTRRVELWSEQKRKPVETGLLIHHYLSQVECKEDWKRIEKKIRTSHPAGLAGLIIERIENILQMAEASFIFDCRNRILTERSILHKQTYRPDRLVIDDENNVSVIDFKTGKRENSHVRQIQNYAKLLADAGFKNIKKYLIYINEKVEIVQVP